MATSDGQDEASATHEIPSTEEYTDETSELRSIELPVMGFSLPVEQAPPGVLMSSMEDYGMGGLFAGDPDVDDMLSDDGSVGLNTFMREEIVPRVATEETNKDAVHWSDKEISKDPDVDDFDLAVLKDEDLAALIKGMVVGDEDGEVDDKLEQFP